MSNTNSIFHIQNISNMKQYKVLGVCNGQGIGLFPFKGDKRFKILGNLEVRGVYFTPKNEQWIDNFPGIPLFRDLNRCKNYLEGKKVHIIVSNPACGGQSILRISRKKDFKSIEEQKADPTMVNFIESVHHFKPHVFLLENLPKLLEVIPENQWEKEIFPDYNLVFHNHSVSEWGNSQISRNRLVIIGVKKSSLLFELEQFLFVKQMRALKTTQDLLFNLPKNGNIIEDLDKIVSMFHPDDKNKTKLSLKQVQRLWTNEFRDEWKWPWVNSKGSRGTLPGVYRNKPNGYPMTARKADRQFKWNGLPMSPRELARIMGIPDKFKIHIEEDRKNYWINKGRLIVTQTFPYEIGLWFKECLLNR